MKTRLLESLNHQVCNFNKKETPTPAFSCDFFEIFKNTFFTEHRRAVASLYGWQTFYCVRTLRIFGPEHYQKYVQNQN